ncbi:MAG: iron ABC transporter permease [Burkholderiales bacterium]|nr:MAG: iron ABC transporter permease [Burkholderiales bacterium]
MRHGLLLVALALAGAGVLALALALGSVRLSASEVWQALLAGKGTVAGDIVWQLRLPRALAAFGTGAALALAGCLMQVLLRNPLADPYVLGASGGAAVAALGAMLLGFALPMQQAMAFIGALFSVALVFQLGRGDGSWSHGRLLLTGVVVAAGWGALITLLLALAPDAQLRGMLFWLIGDVSAAEGAWLTALAALLALGFSLPLGRDLNLLSRGELLATTLGLSVARLRWLVYALASLLTAAAVSTAGAVGFVGLLVPHLLRLGLGGDHRLLVPACLLGGGAYLTLADTLARTLLAPRQLPVGALTALVGVPLFLALLRRGRV